jgi:RHS repeat-associated protein
MRDNIGQRLLRFVILVCSALLASTHAKAQSLPTGWSDADIGAVGVAGSASYSNGVFTVSGAGSGLFTAADSFNFANQTLTGDGSIVARVLTDTHYDGYAGVMIRDSLNAGAMDAALAYDNRNAPGYFYYFYRRTTGATPLYASDSGNLPLPYWVKVSRSSNSFSAYESLDGVNWTQVGATQVISMGQTVYVGLCVTSRDTSSLATATFDNVSINSVSSPAPTIMSVSATTGNIASQVVISGTGYGATQGTSAVYLNGAVATVNSWSATSITVTIPSAATSGPLSVAVAPGMNGSNPVRFTVTTNPLPSGWLDQDVGATGLIGSGTFLNSNNSSTDGFHFVYQPMSGDGTILARVTTLQGTQAGVMIRETLDPGSTNEYLWYYSTSPQEACLSNRLSPGANTNGLGCVQNLTLPYWLKLTRSGNFVSAYTSGDGVNWTMLGSPQIVTMQQTTYIGLAVTSRGTTSLATATFDNVSFNTSTSPAPAITSVSGTTGSVGSQITISGTNFGSSQSSSLVYLNGTSVTVNSWTDTSITATIPTGATSGPLVVSVAPTMNDSNPVLFTVTAQPLQSGWFDQDVGATGLRGSTSYSGGVYTVNGAGTGVAGTADGIHFVYEPVTTDATIIARVTSISTNYAWAGVMIRETLDASSATIFPYIRLMPPSTYYNYVAYRTGADGPTGQAGGATVTLPYWVKAVRTGNTLSAYASPDGTNWSQLGATQTITTAQTVYVGIAVASSYTTSTGTATFDNVSITLGNSLPNPVISGLSPVGGVPGSTVTITGSGFGAAQGTSKVFFSNSALAAISSWSDSQIVAVVPAGASVGPVSVQILSASGPITAMGPTFLPQFKSQLSDSLGNQTNYTAQVFGGRWYAFSYDGPGCSTCSDRGNIQYEYDTNGNVLFATDALGNTTTKTYDSSNNLLSEKHPLDAVNSATTTYTYNSFGEVLTATDPLSHVMSYTYDSHGNLLTVTTPVPGTGATASVTTFTYDTKGELLTIKDPLNNVTTLTYNPVGLIATITDAQNNVTTYGYDAHGNRTSVTDALNHVTTFAYDAGDRLTQITYPDNTTTTFGYDYRGRRTSVTDQNGKTTTYAYDDADRLTSVTDAANHVTTYGYDSESNLTGITDANNNVTTFEYDPFGRVTKTTFPSGNIETYSYDTNNNLITKTDRKNQTITYTYDLANRLTAKTYPDSTSVAYTYDKASRLTQVTDPTGTYSFTFDNMGRLISTSTNYTFLPSKTFTTSYTYDKASNRTGFTDPEGGSTTYAYDTLNRLTTLTPPSAFTTGSFGFSYDALSRRTQMTRPNGVTTNYAYDNLSRLLSVLHQLSGSTIDGATYTLDNAGNRTAKTDQRTAVTTSFGYDSIYQLLSATQGATTTESYTYDPVGNRTASLGVASYTTNSSNQMTANSNASYTYDSNGNTLTKVVGSNTTSYAWDFENRMTSVTLPGSGGTVSFKYDPFGRRIYKSSSSGTSVYAYDGDNVVEETNGSGGVVARYSQGIHTDEPLAMLRSGATSYYQADGLDSVTSLSNAAGALAQTYTFDSFGKLTASSGSLTNPFQYTSREFDVETNLQFSRNRYYDPASGRFLSEDPIGFDGGGNFYVYGQNSPIDESDPDGLTGKDKWYGYNDPDFHKWFHRCWKQPGDPDADKAGIQEAFEEWVRRGRPKGGKCGDSSGPKKKPCGCNQKTNFELQMDEQSNRYMQHFWEDILIGDVALGIVGTAGALGLLGEGCVGAGAGGAARPPAPPIPIRPPAPPIPKPAPPLPLPKAS